MMDERSASNTFKILFETASNAFKLIRNEAISPEKTKKLKEWGITEAADMIGRSTQTLRTLEENGTFKARQIEKGRRVERVYSLEEINKLRDYFGTRIQKPKNAETAILGFVNFKGGAGKTTSAISASQYFAKKGYKVLFVDCDSQGSATQMFGYIPDENFSENETLLDVLTSENSDSISKVIVKTYWDGLDLIPANLSLYNAELMIPSEIAEYAAKTNEQLPFYNRLNKSLKKISSNYDIIILDCPPSMGMISINAIFSANALVIQMPPVMVDFASTIQFFKMVNEVMERLPKKEYAFIRLMITKFNGRSSAKQLQELLRGFLGQYIMSNNMIESEAISKGSANMQTLYELDKIDGDKRTYERAIEQANRVNEELESLIQIMWEKTLVKAGFSTLEKELIK